MPRGPTPVIALEARVYRTPGGCASAGASGRSVPGCSRTSGGTLRGSHVSAVYSPTVRGFRGGGRGEGRNRRSCSPPGTSEDNRTCPARISSVITDARASSVPRFFGESHRPVPSWLSRPFQRRRYARYPWWFTRILQPMAKSVPYKLLVIGRSMRCGRPDRGGGMSGPYASPGACGVSSVSSQRTIADQRNRGPIPRRENQCSPAAPGAVVHPIAHGLRRELEARREVRDPEILVRHGCRPGYPASASTRRITS